MGSAGEIIIRIVGDAKGLSAGLGQAEGQVAAFGKTAEKSGGAVGGFGKKAIVAMAGIAGGFMAMRKIVEVGREYGGEMMKMRALTGATEEESAKLKKTALDLSNTLPYGPAEAAKAMQSLYKAGYQVNGMMQGLKDVAPLATLGNMELGEAADLATSAVKAFSHEGLKVPQVVDIMATAVKNSKMSYEDYTAGLKILAPAAATTNQSMEELSAAMAALSSVGMAGSRSGRPLITLMQQMMDTADATKLAMAKATGDPETIAAVTSELKGAVGMQERLGIAVFDSAGKMRPLSQILGELKGKLSGMSEEQKINTVSTLFSAGTLKVLMPLLTNASGEYDRLIGAMKNYDGAAKKQVGTLEKGWGYQLKMLKAQLKTFAVDIFTSTAPVVINIVSSLQKVAKSLLPGVAGTFKGALGAFAGVVSALNKMKLLVPIVGTLIVYWLGKAAVGALTKLAASLAASFATLGGSQIGIAVGLIAQRIQSAFVTMFPGITAGFANMWAAIQTGAMTFATSMGWAVSSVGMALAASAAQFLPFIGLLYLNAEANKRDAIEAKKRAEEYKASKKAQDEAATAVQPMIGHYRTLQAELATLTPNTAEYAAKMKEVQQAARDIALTYPGLISGMTEQGEVILETTEQIDKFLDSLSRGTDKQKEQAAAMRGPQAEMELYAGRVEDASRKLNNIEKAGTRFHEILVELGGDDRARVVMDAYARSIKDGDLAYAKFIDRLNIRAGTPEAELLDELQAAVRGATGPYEEFMLALQDAGEAEVKLAEKGAKAGAKLQELKQAMIEAAGAAGAQWGQPDFDATGLLSQMGAIFASAEPQAALAGQESVAAFVQAIQMNRGMAEAEASAFGLALSQRMAAGDWNFTGVQVVDEFMLSFAQRMSVAALQAAGAGGQISLQLVSALRSGNMAVQQVATEQVAQYLTGMAQASGKAPEEARKIAEDTINALKTGDFTSSGVETIDKWAKGAKDALGGKDFSSDVKPITLKVDKKAPEDVKKAAQDANAALKELTQGKRVALNSDQAKTARERITKLQDDVRTLTNGTWTVHVKAQPNTLKVDVVAVTHSTAREWQSGEDAGAYFAREVMAGANGVGATMGVNLGSPTADASKAAALVAKLSAEVKALLELSKTRAAAFVAPFGEFLQRMRAGPVNEVRAAIEGVVDAIWRANHAGTDWNHLTEEQGAEIRGLREQALQAYMDAQGAVDGAQNKVNELTKALQAQQDTLQKLQQAYGDATDRLRDLQGAQLKGENATDDALVRAQKKVADLRYLILEEQSKGTPDYQKIYDLQTQLDEAQKKTELLQAKSATYDAQKAVVAADVKKQTGLPKEYTAKDLTAQTVAAQKSVDSLEKAIKNQQTLVTNTQTALRGWQEQLAEFKETVKELADYFKQKWQEMVSGTPEGGVPQYAHGGGIPRTMQILAHAREFMVNRKGVGVAGLDFLKGLNAGKWMGPMGLVPVPAAVGGGGGVTVNINSLHLHGVQDVNGLNDELMTISRKAERRARVGGK